MATTAAVGRSYEIDTVKCLLIFSIFVFHYGQSAGGWYPFFGSFHVPAFFMVSGFWALRHSDRSVWSFVKNAAQNYLLMWLCWVCIYPLFYMVTEGYDWRTTLQLFVRYLCAVRSSGIGGMWFVPAFFVVTLCYFLVAKVIKRIPRLNENGQALVNCAVALAVYLVFRYTVPAEERWLFSLDQVPIHWFYYALGRVAYSGYRWLQTRSPRCRQGVYALSAVTSGIYMVLMFFDWDTRLWGGVARLLPWLTEAVGVMMALCGLFWVARAIRCTFLARIGRSTLGLCLCENVAKAPLAWGMNALGWTVSSSWMPFVLSAAAVVLGCFMIHPIVEWGRQLMLKPFHKKGERSV